MSQSLKILVLAENLDINASSAAKGRLSLIRNLLKSDVAIKVLHYSRQEISIEGCKSVSIKEKKSIYYFLGKLVILLQRFTALKLNELVEKNRGFSFTHTADALSMKKALIQEDFQSYDFVLTLSLASSFRTHKALLYLPQWHSKWLAYVHDPYPMHSYPRPYDWVEPGHQYKRNFFKEISLKACRIIYPSQLLAQWMESYYHEAQSKAIVIPHLIDDSLQINTDLPSYFQPEYFNILHAGLLMSARDPRTLLAAFQQFLIEIPEAQKDARLIFVGRESVFHNEIRELQKNTLQIILSAGYENFDKTYSMQLAAAINVILEAKGPLSPFLPGKFPHCVAANKPILLLGPHYSESRRILGNDYPYYSEIDDQLHIKSIIIELYKLWKNDRLKFNLDMPAVKTYLSNETLEKALKKLES
ncbi:UDP-glycosyltransferase [Nonlabens ulvanivorans]|uniref:UDP-glycosyltransferase n=1 Tax=Nonlabens ulvanivorans TaxID=906888 RepID=UPI0037C92144